MYFLILATNIIEGKKNVNIKKNNNNNNTNNKNNNINKNKNNSFATTMNHNSKQAEIVGKTPRKLETSATTIT